jgi:hypothetical protein
LASGFQSGLGLNAVRFSGFVDGFSGERFMLSEYARMDFGYRRG